MLDRSQHHPVLSVSALARAARLLVEEHFPMVWVEGEVSNFRKPASGHWYFTLKDDTAQLRCAMFAGRNRAVRFTPRDGTQVLLRGRVSFYEPRGDFQLIADHLEPAGEGALRAAFEALKARLEGEGLFAPERKRPLPALPRRLAVISSASGAALRDVLHVIARRFPVLEVILLPVAVQGDNAEAEVLDALSRVPAAAADVVLITRRGGSLEDLWTFNLESVARALAACPVPTVSAVGHQTDFTITDFVADLRAPTPSAGAELITPDQADFLTHLQRLNERLQRGMDYGLERRQRSLAALQRNLALLRPAQQIAQHLERLRRVDAALRGAVGRNLTAQSARASAAARTLQAVSPLATLGRGYTVLTRAAGGRRQPVTSAADTRAGETLTAHLHDGALDVRVESVDDDNRLPRLPDA
ncbi:MAG: exodeoxyribonuclease VII large subunit [Gammaproteobacteria bacterium]|nr:exodeoxyribonuclease VII large subunit [Gammaproteobacteria bacterium]